MQLEAALEKMRGNGYGENAGTFRGAPRTRLVTVGEE